MKFGRRKIFTVTTAVSLAALVIAGTWAWTNFNAQIINVFAGSGSGEDSGDSETGPGGTLHNNHHDLRKDVFIENWGDEDLFVRIRLSEYMELGEGAGLFSTETSSETGLPIPNPANEAVSLANNATIDNELSWNVHRASANNPSECIDDPGFHRYWTWNMGGGKYYFPAPEDQRSDPRFVAENSGFDLTEDSVNNDGIAAQSTRWAEVMTMQEWLAGGREVGDIWVLDTDGWAYWAAPLEPGIATGLLFNGLELAEQPAEDYFYAIYVDAQMATRTGEDMDGWLNNYSKFGNVAQGGGWTTEGEALIQLLVYGEQTGNEPDNPEEPENPEEPDNPEEPEDPSPAQEERLVNMQTSGSGGTNNASWHTENRKMNDGNDTSEVLSVRVTGSSAGRAWREYRVDGQYSSISGRLFLADETNETSRTGNHLVIWGDGEELYRSPEMVAGSPIVDFDVDISGVSVLRVEFVLGAPGSGSFDARNIIIGIDETRLIG